jgi:hypothetical protein
LAYSSTYGTLVADTTKWSPEKALGAPDVYPLYSDNENAWASETSDGQREFLVLGFFNPQMVDTVKIYETYAPGAIDTVYLRDASTENWIKIYETTAAGAGGESRILTINYSTSSSIDAIRIAINSPEVTNWNEIDAVEIIKSEASSINYDKSVSLKVFPNPANNTLYIKGASGKVKIFNILGNLLFEEELKNGSIQISQLSPGLYICNVNGQSLTFVKK